jgi:hypothetical protein
MDRNGSTSAISPFTSVPSSVVPASSGLLATTWWSRCSSTDRPSPSTTTASAAAPAVTATRSRRLCALTRAASVGE